MELMAVAVQKHESTFGSRERKLLSLGGVYPTAFVSTQLRAMAVYCSPRVLKVAVYISRPAFLSVRYVCKVNMRYIV